MRAQISIKFLLSFVVSIIVLLALYIIFGVQAIELVSSQNFENAEITSISLERFDSSRNAYNIDISITGNYEGEGSLIPVAIFKNSGDRSEKRIPTSDGKFSNEVSFTIPKKENDLQIKSSSYIGRMDSKETFFIRTDRNSKEGHDIGYLLRLESVENRFNIEACNAVFTFLCGNETGSFKLFEEQDGLSEYTKNICDGSISVKINHIECDSYSEVDIEANGGVSTDYREKLEVYLFKRSNDCVDRHLSFKDVIFLCSEDIVSKTELKINTVSN